MPRAETLVVVAGVRISHPERVIYPDLGLTKLDVARYYDAIGKWMLPHVRGRPLTLVHCPNGLNGACHYLRHSKVWGPSALRRVQIREKTKVGTYLVADTRDAIVSLAQMGVLEIHTWNSTIEDIEHPDRLVWDLDPGPKVTWPQIVAAARLLRSILKSLRLEAWVKTTGGQGLHIVVPVKPVQEWSECLTFARELAQSVERANPAMFTTAYAKRGRESKILIDYLRNNRTNTSVSAFSTRTRPGAPVSVPIGWSDLKTRQPNDNIASVLKRFTRVVDPWNDYWRCRQRIGNALAALARV